MCIYIYIYTPVPTPKSSYLCGCTSYGQTTTPKPLPGVLNGNSIEPQKDQEPWDAHLTLLHTNSMSPHSKPRSFFPSRLRLQQTRGRLLDNEPRGLHRYGDTSKLSSWKPTAPNSPQTANPSALKLAAMALSTSRSDGRIPRTDWTIKQPGQGKRREPKASGSFKKRGNKETEPRRPFLKENAAIQDPPPVRCRALTLRPCRSYQLRLACSHLQPLE